MTKFNDYNNKFGFYVRPYGLKEGIFLIGVSTLMEDLEESMA